MLSQKVEDTISNWTHLATKDLQDLKSHMMEMDIPNSAYAGTTVKKSYTQ